MASFMDGHADRSKTRYAQRRTAFGIPVKRQRDNSTFIAFRRKPNPNQYADLKLEGDTNLESSDPWFLEKIDPALTFHDGEFLTVPAGGDAKRDRYRVFTHPSFMEGPAALKTHTRLLILADPEVS
jgi:hypothetical protein